MPRKTVLDTETVKKLLYKTAKEVKDGTLEPKRGTCAISAYRGILYGNQIQAQERRIETDARLAENMERLNDYLDHGGKFPGYMEDLDHEGEQLQSDESISGGIWENIGGDKSDETVERKHADSLSGSSGDCNSGNENI